MPGQEVPISELKADLFRALGNPGRIRILEQLVEGERSVGDLQPHVGLELSHLSQQLGVLRRANLVTARKDGDQVFYSVKNPLLADVLAYRQAAPDQLAHRDPEPARRPARATRPMSADGPDVGPADADGLGQESRAAMRGVPPAGRGAPVDDPPRGPGPAGRLRARAAAARSSSATGSPG